MAAGAAAGRGGNAARRGPSARIRWAARVLVVDDLARVRDSITDLLCEAGYDAVGVASGPAALAELERRGADVLLTDLHMPEMSGWDLVRAVRARRLRNLRGGRLCVGLYSALLGAVSREQLTRADVDFALTKLSGPDAVLDTLERALAWSEVP